MVAGSADRNESVQCATILAVADRRTTKTDVSQKGTHMLRHFVSGVVVGLFVASLTQGHAQDKNQGYRLGVKTFPAAGGGVKIAEVAEHSPAKEIGLKPGQTMLTLAGKLVKTNADVQALLAEGDTVDVVYKDGDQFYQVTAPLVSKTFNYFAANGKSEKRTKLVPTNMSRFKVSDPRKGKR
jgi:predicted metalloprotease with PDZ domain